MILHEFPNAVFILKLKDISGKCETEYFRETNITFFSKLFESFTFNNLFYLI
jgi:hypothetical protein